MTPEDHPAITTAVDTYERVASPVISAGGSAGQLRKEPRVARWIFSTDGVGFPIPAADAASRVPARKQWIAAGSYSHPAMLGIGPGLEQNTHKIGECMDAREFPPVIGFLARFPSLYRKAISD